MFKGANAFYAVHNLWILTVTRGGALHSSGTTGVGGVMVGGMVAPEGWGRAWAFTLSHPAALICFTV